MYFKGKVRTKNSSSPLQKSDGSRIKDNSTENDTLKKLHIAPLSDFTLSVCKSHGFNADFTNLERRGGRGARRGWAVSYWQASCLLPAEPGVSGSVCEPVWFLLFVFQTHLITAVPPTSLSIIMSSHWKHLIHAVLLCVCVYRTFLDLALVSVIPLLYLSSVNHRYNTVIGWKQCVSAAWGKNNYVMTFSPFGSTCAAGLLQVIPFSSREGTTDFCPTTASVRTCSRRKGWNKKNRIKVSSLKHV